MTRITLPRRAALALPLLAALPRAAGAQARFPEVWRMGAVLNLSGPTAAQGADFRAGLELAAAQWNARGGLGGTRIEIIFEDSAAQPARAVTAAQKLIQVDRVNVLANVYSSPVLAVVPITDRARVLQISAGATSPRLVGISRYFMTSVANAALEAEVALAFARREHNARRISVFYGNDDFGTGMRDAVRRMWPAGGGTIADDEGVDPARADLAAVATKLAAGRPDAIYVALSGVSIGAAVKQLREARYTAPLLSHQGFESRDLFTVAGSAAENSFWTSSANPDGGALEASFQAAFRQAYSRDPSIFVRTHFDLGMSLFEAMSRMRQAGQEWSSENIRAALLGLGTYTGVLGPFSYREDGTALRELDIRTYRDGNATVHMNAATVQQRGIFDFGARRGA